MQIGFLTSCLRGRTLPEIITWAGDNHFPVLELSAFPPRDSGPDPNLDVDHLDAGQAAALLDLGARHGVGFSCLTYCDNMLHPDLAQREKIIAHARAVISAARQLNVGVVSLFIGRDPSLPRAQNLDMAVQVYRPLLEFAGESRVRIAIENCPMPGWQFEGLPGNLFYSPELWEEVFARLPYDHFGLNLDPSHLVWLGVDYVAAVKEYGKRIFHTHAKDTEVFADRRARMSILNAGWGGWWRYRLPGLGEIDWHAWTHALEAANYRGPLSIEHEDPEWEGSEDKIKRGLLLACQNLEAAQL